jgi:polyhydroxyalkanoate synthesis regulator phasin
MNAILGEISIYEGMLRDASNELNIINMKISRAIADNRPDEEAEFRQEYESTQNDIQTIESTLRELLNKLDDVEKLLPH